MAPNVQTSSSENVDKAWTIFNNLVGMITLLNIGINPEINLKSQNKRAYFIFIYSSVFGSFSRLFCSPRIKNDTRRIRKMEHHQFLLIARVVQSAELHSTSLQFLPIMVFLPFCSFGLTSDPLHQPSCSAVVVRWLSSKIMYADPKTAVDRCQSARSRKVHFVRIWWWFNVDH